MMDKEAVKETVTKEYLRSYSLLLEEIEGEEERLKNLLFKAGSSSIGDGMPHGSADKDRMATQVCIITDLRDKLDKLRSEERIKRQNIEEALNELVDIPQERRVIRLKYIDRMEWDDIRGELFRKYRDYSENEEKYKRLTFRIHGNALAKLNQRRKG